MLILMITSQPNERMHYYFRWIDSDGQTHQKITVYPILSATADRIADFAVQCGATLVEYGPILTGSNGSTKPKGH